MATPARTIDDVLQRLDAIIDDAHERRQRVGYFAALYRGVTARVKAGIAAGRFEDAARMERLDVVFANRYLDAYASHQAGRPTSRSWRVAFDAAPLWPPLVLQHLLLGMNAHISLDLGVATAEVAPGAALASIAGDFGAINTLLGEMIDDVQDRITSVSPWMGVLDTVGQRDDERLCGFCIGAARDFAWSAATRIAPLSGAERDDEIDRLDALAAALALPIRRPGLLARAALLGVRLREARDVRRVIEALDQREVQSNVNRRIVA